MTAEWPYVKPMGLRGMTVECLCPLPKYYFWHFLVV